MSKGLRFIWRWVVPIAGLLIVLIFIGAVGLGSYIEHRYTLKEPKILSEVRVASPNGGLDVAKVKFETNVIDALVGDGPLSPGYLYVVEPGKPISWNEDWYIAAFTDEYEDDNDSKRKIDILWQSEKLIRLEYCGAALSEFDNQAELESGETIEIELVRTADCDIEIGEVGLFLDLSGGSEQ